MENSNAVKTDLLVLDPPKELVFKGPFTETPCTLELRLFNPNSRAVCYKVKTTAPKCYCVRPNCGVIQPKCNICVSILLQPAVETITEKTRHRFMVQCAVLSDGVNDFNMEKFWREVQQRDICDLKLKCVFEQVSANANANVNNLNASANAVNNGTHAHDSGQMMSVNSSSSLTCAYSDTADTLRQRVANSSANSNANANRKSTENEYHETTPQRSDATFSATNCTPTLTRAEPEVERRSFLKMANAALCQHPFVPLLLYTAVCVFLGVLIGKLF